MARENAVVEVKWDATYTTMTLAVVGSGMPALTFDRSKVNAGLHVRGEAHGFEQRLRDAAAKPRDGKSGLPASPLAKYNAVKKLVDHYMSGNANWSPDRSESIGLDETVLSQAMAKAFEGKPAKDGTIITADQIRARVVGATPIQRLEMRNDERVKAHYDAIVAELAKGQGDAVKNALEGW